MRFKGWIIVPTRRETALASLFSVLSGIDGPKVLRNAELPEQVPAGGMIILRDGSVGEPVDITLSPVSYAWQHRAGIELFVHGNDTASRASSLDDLIAAVDAAITADHTLGGTVDYAKAGPPEEPEDLPIEGAQSFKAAIMSVMLFYTSPSSAG
jgi:hypothetical protein